MPGRIDPFTLKLFGTFLVSLAIWLFVRLGLAVRNGELRLRAGVVNRAKEPWQFWFFVIGFSWLNLIMILLGTSAFAPDAATLARLAMRRFELALSGWIGLFASILNQKFVV